MGLIDREYMHERSAFAPTAEPSAIRTLITVLLLVASLFALYRFLESYQNKQADNPRLRPSQMVQPHAFPPVELPHGGHRSELSTFENLPEHRSNNRIVTKCTINGKISYGDGPCARGAEAKQVITRNDHNIMAPIRVARRIEPDVTLDAAPAMAMQNSSETSIHTSGTLRCQSLELEIKRLDSMSRQPQNGQTMDWINNERKMVRDEQFRIPCR